jgi:diguanylate cyclase (GGDEF)-like protein/PAS domain S-box-containing protein
MGTSGGARPRSPDGARIILLPDRPMLPSDRVPPPPPDLTRFFELCPDPLAVLRDDGLIEVANTAMGRLVGLPPDVLVGANPLRWLHPDELDRYQTAFRTSLDAGPTSVPGRLLTADGGWRWFEWHITRDPAVGHVYTAARDIDQHVQTHSELRELATTDWLTGIANRQAVMADLDARVRAGRSTGVLLLDLDGFKQVNDRFGHLHGDEVLQAVVGRLVGCVRGDDLLARLGGDEFVVVTDAVDGIDALASRLVGALDHPIVVGAHQHPLDVSIGGAVWHEAAEGPDDQPVDELIGRLIARADQALYRVKGEGGGAFRHGDRP